MNVIQCVVDFIFKKYWLLNSMTVDILELES